jgi:3-oxoacyl-(acyl-carrier-protein) synthase
MARLEERTVVTGLGPIASPGVGCQAFWAGLSRADPDGKAPTFAPREERVPVEPIFLHRVDGAAVDSVLCRSDRESLPPDPELRLALAAARLALEDAGLQGELHEAALVATWEAPGMDVLLRGLYGDLAAAAPGAPPPPASDEERFARFFARHKDAAYSTQSFLHLHLLARHLGIHGHSLFVNNACASGLYALDAAASLIESGRAPRALVLAAECPRLPVKSLWFQEGGLGSTDGFVRPFDRRRTGLVLGEGAAAIVLEPRARAAARGARIHCDYLGGGFNQEAWKVTIPNFAANHHELALRRALERSRLVPADIDAIVAHGAGTTLSDAYEARAITAVFGDGAAGRPRITALKGHCGHTLGASALLETIALCLALEHGILPAAAGFEEEDPKLRLRLASRPEPLALRTAMKIANGFAGFNAAAVLRREEG